MRGFIREELTNRVLGLRGRDAIKYLQGYTTNDMRLLLATPGTGLFTGLLNNKGRVISTAHVSLPHHQPKEGGPLLLLDVPLDTADTLLSHLRAFRLRSQVEFLDLSATHAVHALVPTGPATVQYSEGVRGVEGVWEGVGSAIGGGSGCEGGGSEPWVGYWDPRAWPGHLGARVIAPRASLRHTLGEAKSGDEGYQTLRRLLGCAEGGEAVGLIPLECNLTLLRGVSFDKGCYLGQELVARTHFRGLVRKRVLPFSSLPGAVIERGADITTSSSQGGDVVGRVLAPPMPQCPVGLAMVRLKVLSHCLPPLDTSVRGEAPNGSSPRLGNPHRETVNGWPGSVTGLDVWEGGGEGGDDVPSTTPSKVKLWVGGGVGVEVSPMLPPWWKHVAHSGSGVEEGSL